MVLMVGFNTRVHSLFERAALAVVHGAQERFYPYLTGRVGDDVVFLNYGYEEDPPLGLALDAADEPERYPIQLYHVTATQAGGLAGKSVLEVGCGHGGGASFLTRTMDPASYVGLDANAAGVAFCRRRHQVSRLEFVHGNAENLPFPAESFDAVINVESAHCYPHFDRFLAEVARVLRPGGALLYADVRQRLDWVSRAEPALNSAPGLPVVSWRPIDAEVLRGMTLNSQPHARVDEELGTKVFVALGARRGAGSRIGDLPERPEWTRLLPNVLFGQGDERRLRTITSGRIY